MARWLVGTSGYVYRDWRRRFYPQALGARDWLPYYAATFETVELNSPFYRLPRAATFRAWAAAVPAALRLRREGEPVPHSRQAPQRAGPARDALSAARARTRQCPRPGADPAALDVPPASRSPRWAAARAVAPPPRALGARGAPRLMARRAGLRAPQARQCLAVPARLEGAAGDRPAHRRFRVRAPSRHAASLRRLVRGGHARRGRRSCRRVDARRA